MSQVIFFDIFKTVVEVWHSNILSEMLSYEPQLTRVYESIDISQTATYRGLPLINHNLQSINTAIPKCSTLPPMLFMVYTNDLYAVTSA